MMCRGDRALRGRFRDGVAGLPLAVPLGSGGAAGRQRRRRRRSKGGERVERAVTPDPADGARALERLAIDDARRAQLAFLLHAHRLTEVTRLNRLLDGSRSETSAEHSWHLALVALVLAGSDAPEVDMRRVLTMLVIHDLVEIEAGDVPIHDEQARLDIAAEEERAAARLFACLPDGEGAQLLGLWHEFEGAATDDARFARAVDRLQPLLLHWAGDGAAWASRGVTVEQERRVMAAIGEFWPSLGPLARDLIADAAARGLLRRA